MCATNYRYQMFLSLLVNLILPVIVVALFFLPRLLQELKVYSSLVPVKQNSKFTVQGKLGQNRNNTDDHKKTFTLSDVFFSFSSFSAIISFNGFFFFTLTGCITGCANKSENKITTTSHTIYYLPLLIKFK